MYTLSLRSISFTSSLLALLAMSRLGDAQTPNTFSDCSQFDGLWIHHRLLEGDAARNPRLVEEWADESFRIRQLYQSYFQKVTRDRAAACSCDDPIVGGINEFVQYINSETTAEEVVAYFADPRFPIDAIYEIDPIVGSNPQLSATWAVKFSDYPVATITGMTLEHLGDAPENTALFIRLVESSDGEYARGLIETIGRLLETKPGSLLADPAMLLSLRTVRFIQAAVEDLEVGTVEQITSKLDEIAIESSDPKLTSRARVLRQLVESAAEGSGRAPENE